MRKIKNIIRILYWDKHEQEWSGFKIVFTFLMIFLFTMAFINQKEEYKQLNCDSGVVLKDCLSQMKTTQFNDFVKEQHEICIKLASNCKN